MTEQKPSQRVRIVLSEEKIARFFPPGTPPKQMEETILKLLEGWQKKRTQQPVR